MILDRQQMMVYFKDGRIKFTPELDAFQLQPNSVDLRIGWNFYVPESWQYGDAGRVAVEPDYLDLSASRDHLKLLKLKPGQHFEVLPHELVLVSSLEKIELNCGDLMAVLHPRSSMVRRGFIIQGGVVDVRYHGHLIIPILNGTNHKLALVPGERAYQLLFYTTANELTVEEAAQHGAAAAKYVGATPYSLEARTDGDEEIDFLKRGDLEGLKQKYSLPTT